MGKVAKLQFTAKTNLLLNFIIIVTFDAARQRVTSCEVGGWGKSHLQDGWPAQVGCRVGTLQQKEDHEIWKLCVSFNKHFESAF